MIGVIYEIIEHDGGWAYRVDGVLSETFPSHDAIDQQIFETVTGSPEPPEQVALDSTHIKAHRCTGAGKGGVGTGDRRDQGWPEQQDSCACR